MSLVPKQIKWEERKGRRGRFTLRELKCILNKNNGQDQGIEMKF